MPFPAYCTQSHASKEHEFEEGQVVSFAIHIHVKPEQTARPGSPGGKPRPGVLLGRAAGEESAKSRPGLPEDLELTVQRAARSSACSPASPSSTCSPASPSSTCSPASPSSAYSTAASPSSAGSASSTACSGRELQLRLVRSSFQPLGLRLEAMEDQEAWEVMGLEPGLVRHWNEKHPEQQILPGDLIMSINGESTAVGMECAMSADPTLEMRVWRPRRVCKVSL